MIFNFQDEKAVHGLGWTHNFNFHPILVYGQKEIFQLYFLNLITKQMKII